MLLQILLAYVSVLTMAAAGVGGLGATGAGFNDGQGAVNRYVIKNMDFIFIGQNAPGEFKPEAEPKLIVLQYDNNRVPAVPFSKDGQWLWEAYECVSPACPFRKKAGKSFVFPNFTEKALARAKNPPPPGEMPPEELLEPISCPQCKQANLDAYRVERYMTDRAKAQMRAMTEKILRENP